MTNDDLSSLLRRSAAERPDLPPEVIVEGIVRGRRQQRRRQTLQVASAGLLVAAVVAAVAATASTLDQAVDPGPPVPVTTAASESEAIPPQLAGVVRRDGLVVRPREAADGTSAEEALTAFSEMYGADSFTDQPTAYAVKVLGSIQPALPPGRDVWMIHVPNVPRDASGPITPDGPQEPKTIDTDLFAFFDAASGDFLLTSYIGP